MYRAPGIDVYEFHAQTKAVRERSLHYLRRHGGVCLTSYGIIVNNTEILATDRSGRDFYWVRNDNALLCLSCGWTESAGWPKINEPTVMIKAHEFRAVPLNFENRHGFTRRRGKHCRGTLPNLMDST